MADMCYYGNVMTTTRWWLCVTILHLQQYSHRLNFYPAAQCLYGLHYCGAFPMSERIALHVSSYCLTDMSRNHVGWAYMSFLAPSHNTLCSNLLINKWHNCGHRWLQCVRKPWQFFTTGSSFRHTGRYTHEATAAFGFNL